MRNDAMGSWHHATERVVTRPRRPRVSRGLDLSGMLIESSVFCIVGLEYWYSSVVSVPEFNTGIRVSYRYWLPDNSLWSPLKHDSLCFGP
ncbi:hypothetical protein GQ457_11G031950 [Hibiscus cannabinus]